MRLIDADALKERYTRNFDYENCIYDGATVVGNIDEAPTVDAEPVRHGQWEYVDYGGFGNWHCSHCREICITNGDYDYCPNCGAKMDGKERRMKEWICRELSTSTIDAENGILTMETELIRCKDCKWWNADTCMEWFDTPYVPADGYCFRAERKEE